VTWSARGQIIAGSNCCSCCSLSVSEKQLIIEETQDQLHAAKARNEGMVDRWALRCLNFDLGVGAWQNLADRAVLRMQTVVFVNCAEFFLSTVFDSLWKKAVWCSEKHFRSCIRFFFDKSHCSVKKSISYFFLIADWFNSVTIVETSHWIQICASLNQHKKMKTEPSRLILQKLRANLELIVVVHILAKKGRARNPTGAFNGQHLHFFKWC